MAEIEKNTAAGTADTPNEIVVPQKGSLGALLRNAREQMGLNQQSLAEIIRLRRFYINALEEEAWEQLPAPVFVKGFIKSYARTVGLDEKNVLALYHHLKPDSTVSHFPVFNNEHPPFPKTYWGVIVLSGVVFFLLIFIFWRGCSAKDHLQSGNVNKYSGSGAAVGHPNPSPVESRTETGLSSSVEEKASTGQQTQDLSAETDKSYMKTSPMIPRSLQPLNGEWILRASAKDETWLEVYKDLDPPQDYTFRAGDKKEWHAKKGFYLVVGNAAGIDFEINGIKFEKLGNPKQVITLRFPENFTRKENGQ